MPASRSSFFEYLLTANRAALEGFERWLLQPGMGFNSLESWWGKKQPRSTPHEGIDLCCYEAAGGRIGRVDQHIRIPATFAGEIIKLDDDFLGKSIYLGHEIWAVDGRRLCTAYGHTQPRAALQVGNLVAAGEIIATIAAAPGEKSLVLPHLHLTFAWLPPRMHPDRLNWHNLGQDPLITLLDPLAILAPPACRLA